MKRPLERYLLTLRTFVDRDDERVWPGHRETIEDPTALTFDFIAHLGERTDRIFTILREQRSANPYTVSSNLFWELQGIYIICGPVEVYAHLAHLERCDYLQKALLMLPPLGDSMRKSASSHLQPSVRGNLNPKRVSDRRS